LIKYQQYLLLNIANEAGTAAVTNKDFAEKYAVLVKLLREGGLNMPLVIDAANWGRNEDYLLTNAAALLNADPCEI
jgi:mannan endo-1,4-beta-mannosidase